MNKRSLFANIIIGSIALLFLLMFFYAILRSSLHPPGYMYKYYYISIAGIMLFTYILIRCKVEFKLNIAVLILTIILSVYAVEIGLSYYNPVRPEHKRSAYVKSLGFSFDSRTNYQVLMDYRNKGINAFIYFNPTQFPSDNEYFLEKEIMPIGFISGTTSIHCNEGGEYLIYKTDEHGFNNPEGLYNGESIDYALIGDSFIKGSCVRQEENIAGNLIKTGKKVLNLGMGNTGPLTQLAILKEYARPVKPKIVFWFFYEGNDHESLALEKQSSIFMKYVNKEFSQGLFEKQKLINDLQIEFHEKKYADAKEQIKPITEKTEEMNINDGATFNIYRSSLRLFHIRRRLGMFGIGQCACKIDPLFKDIFAEAKRVVHEWNGELIFVYLPEWSRYPEKINLCRKRFLNTGKSKVLSAIKDLQIPIIDIESVFSSHSDPLSLFPFRIYGHYNSEGYKLVAEHLEKYISNDMDNTK
jgi:hypothetical protein